LLAVFFSAALAPPLPFWAKHKWRSKKLMQSSYEKGKLAILYTYKLQ
jgi:hypothetical protein